VPHSATTIDAIRNHFRGMGFTDNELEKMLVSSPIYAGFSLPKLTIASEHACVIYDSLGVCSILACLGMIDVITLSEAYRLVTGINKDARDLMNDAERVFNLEKAVNMREGFKREDDWLEEWLHPKRTPEPWGCQAVMTDYYRTRILTRDDIHRLLDEYYELRGWSVEKGIPTREKLIALGLEEIVEQLEK
jgi:aldehyde:ferredoxin oxidoreductase